ncbi:MAG: transglycosylase SLT domain-containing protein [Rhodospirillales bacterium]|nr:transglycosylase SLT domain-containing protein [Rhodospirillales bacterium]
MTAQRLRATLGLIVLLAAIAHANPVCAAPPLAAQAALGNAAATTELANRLELGIGMAPDPARAMALFCRAALDGGRAATFHLAAWLLNDDGPAYDPRLAAAWLHRYQRMEHGIRPAPGTLPPPCPSDAATGLVPRATALAALIDRVGHENGVDPDLIKAVIEVESSYRDDAVSPAGAAGLMQLMPASAQRLKVENRFDIQQNVQGGVAWLAMLLHRYRGRLSLALAAYNAGEAPVDRCACVPGIPETEQYVRRIRALYPPPGSGYRDGLIAVTAPKDRAYASGVAASAPSPRPSP